jgi:adenine-specific DNA-methyltransferase
MTRKGKLELTWVDKDERPRLEPRILVEDKGLSYGDPTASNMLIQGDNLIALKALEQALAGKIKCIYIDPPYNTGSALAYYEDGLEHSIWLTMMRDRLEMLQRLLHPNGVIYVHIDDAEGSYLKVLMDEVFGRHKHLITFYIQVRYPEKTLKQDMLFNKIIEQVHCYGGQDTPTIYQPSKEYNISKFCWYVEEIGEPVIMNMGGKRVDIFPKGAYRISKKNSSHEGLKEIWATGTILDGNSSGRFFRDYLQGRVREDGLGVLYKVYGIGDDDLDYRYFTGPKRDNATKGKYYQGVPTSVKESNSDGKTTVSNFLDLAGAFGNCRHEGGVDFRSGKKPEVLLQQLIELTTRPGDFVLDSFAGSGTTAAVAHKMTRKWIIIEAGEQATTHCVPRLQRVVDGADLTGVTGVTNWQGGGGFKFYRLAETLLVKDPDFGTLDTNPCYTREMLYEAICKIENFRYKPRGLWHGYSSEKRFIHIALEMLNQPALDQLEQELRPDESLLIYYKKRASNLNYSDRVEFKRIPRDLQAKCDFEAGV